MGFYHQDRVLYMAAPFLKRTFPALRAYQFATLSAMAFRTGHPYWGWRFAGMSLHYVQDLTQPYHASLAPGQGTAKLIGINTLAMVGFPKAKNEMVTLLSNQHLAPRKVPGRAGAGRRTGAPGHARDPGPARHQQGRPLSPAWTTLYARDVVAAEAASHADQLVAVLLDACRQPMCPDPQL